MFITIIKSKDFKRGAQKVPISTLEDPKQFEFETVNVSSMFSASDIVTSNFVLNYPLNPLNAQTLISPRTKKDLGQYFAPHTDYLILDFDDVPNNAVKDRILDFFKPYKHIFTESRSANSISNFNLKGILAVDKFSPEDCKRAIKYFNHHLERNGVENLADVTSARAVQITAPAASFSIVSSSETGKSLTRKDIKLHNQIGKVAAFKPEVREAVFEMFAELNIFPTSPTHEDKVNFTCLSVEDQNSTEAKYAWYSNSPFSLWNWNSSFNIDISTQFRARHNIKNFIQKTALSDLLVPLENHNRVILNQFRSEFIEAESPDLNQTLIDWRDRKGVLCLKSAMGTGKTKIIERALKMFKNVLIVTPRVTLAAELANRLSVKLYTEEGFESSTSLCCQYDSLFKIDMRRFQCVIIDEYMTLESHIVQNMNERYAANNMAKLHALLSNPDIHTLILDALLCQNVMDIFHNRDVYYCENLFRDTTPIMSHKYLSSFLKELSDSRNRRVTVSCISRAKMHGLKHFMDSCGHNSRIISSEIPVAERQQILEDLAADRITAVIYSPSMSVGVSIECRIDRHFHFDPGGVVAPIQSIQMMKRARKPKQIDYFIGRNSNERYRSLEEIKQNLIQSSNPTAFCVFNTYGDVQLSAPGKMYSTLLYHSNVWEQDYRLSFDMLMRENFYELMHCTEEVVEFKGVQIGTLNTRETGYTPKLCDEIISRLGDHVASFEQFLPGGNSVDVYNFFKYNELRRAVASDTYCKSARARAALRADFTFEFDLAKFKEMQDLFKLKSHLGSKQIAKFTARQRDAFGLHKTKSLLHDKWEIREDFEKLYQAIWDK